jgi:hypothetical protein
VQDPTTSSSGDLIPIIRGSRAHPRAGQRRYHIEGRVHIYSAERLKAIKKA